MKRQTDKRRQYGCRGGVLILAFLSIVFFGCLPARAAVLPEGYSVGAKTTQLVTIRYQGGSRGLLRYYERDENGKFRKIFQCRAYLGKNGLGKKKEGDGKTPEGVFSLGQAFGIRKNPGTEMPYVKVGASHYWCTDSGTAYYNTLISTKETTHRCSGEHLIDYKEVYNYAIFIGYNKKGKAGKGSAIFLHCSRNRATAGCAAIPEKYMKRLLRRLNPEANPKIAIYS